MALFRISRVAVRGISACVPAQTISVADTSKSEDYNAADFSQKTGVRQAHLSNDYTAADLCVAAAERLIGDLGWEKKDIDGILFCSQHPDYILPASSCIIQDRLGLSRECFAMDISLGCSGWVYSMSTAAALLANGGMRKILLLAGDARKRVPCEFDPLFGFAGTATALEYTADESDVLDFHTGTDGSGYDAIIIPDGGARNQMTPASFEKELIDGQYYHRLQTRMKGMDVFAFGISTAPKSIKKLLEFSQTTIEDYDYFVLHQANMMMNEKIRKKLNIPEEKLPYSLPDFGNTSMASIPLTIVTQLRGKCEVRLTRFMCCGFGVGLSWGSVAFTGKGLCISELIEL